jgi:hypothetical protein
VVERGIWILRHHSERGEQAGILTYFISRRIQHVWKIGAEPHHLLERQLAASTQQIEKADLSGGWGRK